MAGGKISASAIKRSTILALFVFGLFGALLLKILFLQTFGFEKYQKKVIDQFTTESAVPADRGKIYDRNGSVLATNITTYRVFISPSSIKSAQDELGANSDKNYYKLVSEGLSQILNVDYNNIYKQATEYTRYLDRTIKRKVDEATADIVIEFINENGLENMIYLEAQSTRYYPKGSLGAHVIGFTSSDGEGLYGIEYQYDKYLSGIDGYYIKARDSYGNEMPNEYTSYIEGIDGYNVKTTLDTTIQGFLEEQIQLTVAEHRATNRATGIVMDVKSGAILAMATSSSFDLNDPWQLDEKSEELLRASGYSSDSDEYDKLRLELLTSMWSNKAITESYIPGSTFKIITSSMGFEEGVVTVNDVCTCNGSLVFGGHKIHCHKTQGHGTLTFSQGLQQSCNVWFMTLGKRVGIENYVKYAKAFGYYDKTGIDLPGEGNSIFASEMTELDLVIYAFGQNFNITPIQHISAISAVANGGTLVTPYVVEQITDNAGNIIYEHEVDVKRQVVSEEVCKTIAVMLEEGVSGDGGAKNAYVAGYRVAAKTGTSEKKTAGDEGEYICSCAAFAPADDPEIAIIIVVDEPQRGSLYGSTVAAPYVGNALKNILPYMGVEEILTQEELDNKAIQISSYKNWSVSYATRVIEGLGLKVQVVGDGNVVKSQLPESGSYIERAGGTIVLYTTNEDPQGSVTVPNLLGKTAALANQTLINLGLNVKIEGTPHYLTGDDKIVVVEQSIPSGALVPKGTVVTITFRYVGQDD